MDQTIRDKLEYEFVKYFVIAAESKFASLEGQGTFADICGVLSPGIGKAAAAASGDNIFAKGAASILPIGVAEAVSFKSKAENKKTKQSIIASLEAGCSDEVAMKFRTLFVEVALEVYFTFKYQFNRVSLLTKIGESKNQGIEQLATFAGMRCFDHFCIEPKPKNLGKILVKSTDTWDNFIAKQTSRIKQLFSNKIQFEIDHQTRLNMTAFDFFKKCIPCFDTRVEQVADELNKKMKFEKNQIGVNKMKANKSETKHHKFFFRPCLHFEMEELEPGMIEFGNPESFRNGALFELFNLSDHSDQITQYLDKLSGNVDSKISKPDSVYFQIQNLPQGIVGRQEYLQKLEDFAKNSNSDSTVKSRTRVVCGHGGIGKTTLVKTFIRIFEGMYTKCNVIFIFAESFQTMNASFEILAKNPNLRTGQEKKESNEQEKTVFKLQEVKDKIFRRLCDRPCLIVYDNVQSFKNEDCDGNGVEDFMPPELPHDLAKNLTILITTRTVDQKLWYDCPLMDLNCFSKSESVEFIKTKIKKPGSEKLAESEEHVDQLAKVCQNLPLALDLSVSYIYENSTYYKKTGYTIRRFLAEDGIVKLANKKDKSYSDTVFSTWRLSVANIERDSDVGSIALRILKYIAFATPDFISYDEISNCIDEDEVRTGKAINLLLRYSIITSFKNDEGEERYTIHRLVQFVTKSSLTTNFNETKEIIETLAAQERMKFKCILVFHQLMLWVDSRWDDNTIWDFAKGISNLICGKDIDIPEVVRECALKYLRDIHSASQVISPVLASNTTDLRRERMYFRSLVLVQHKRASFDVLKYIQDSLSLPDPLRLLVKYDEISFDQDSLAYFLLGTSTNSPLSYITNLGECPLIDIFEKGKSSLTGVVIIRQRYRKIFELIWCLVRTFKHFMRGKLLCYIASIFAVRMMCSNEDMKNSIDSDTIRIFLDSVIE